MMFEAMGTRDDIEMDAHRPPSPLRFIDLFAGLGGFHLALQRLGHECVFASELDPQLRALYQVNFGIEAAGDIREIADHEIPAHDVLCAGFPCQPFSKAGEQNGLDDPRWGNLFYQILRIAQHHKPHFLMLENVPNFERHDKGRTWRVVKELIEGAGYDVQINKLSPHRYGIPQVRERIFIVGSRDGLGGFEWPEKTSSATSIRTVLDEAPPNARRLSGQALACIAMWQDFLNQFPRDEEPPSFPVWAMEFGATYPYSEMTPHAVGAAKLQFYCGAHGMPLAELDDEAVFAALPSYARTKEDRFPNWKVQFIKQNRAFYARHREWLDRWRPQLLQFPASFQKFEWNAKGSVRNLSELVLQFRASGLRAKRPTTAPSLVAMTTTQVPVITWEGRYMTPRECAKLQSMEDLVLPPAPTRAYTALGNAVNVRVVELVADALLAHEPAPNRDSLAPDIQLNLPYIGRDVSTSAGASPPFTMPAGGPVAGPPAED